MRYVGTGRQAGLGMRIVAVTEAGVEGIITYRRVSSNLTISSIRPCLIVVIKPDLYSGNWGSIPHGGFFNCYSVRV